MQPPKLPSTRKLLAAALLLYFGRLLYKLARWVHHVLTSVDESKKVHHNCIPPADYKPAVVQQESLQLVKQRFPELLPLVESGILVAVQPAKMLAGKLQKQQAGPTAAVDGEQQAQQEGVAQADAAEGPSSTADLHAQLVESPALQSLLVNELPELLFIIGTVHVSKQSAEQVKQVLRALSPSLVVLELCQARIQAMLVEPYRDPLHDLEPCPDKMAAAAALKQRSTAEILSAALKSRDHNVLSAMMGGMYSQLEDKLEVRAGCEFIAARATLIEMLQEQQQQQQPAHEAVWVERCVAGDRELLDTLLGLWGSLKPWRRLKFIWDLLTALVCGISEDDIKSLAEADMVELLLTEFAQEYPEVMRPLLHDRNWVLATNSLQAAQISAHNAPGSHVVAIVGKGHIPGMVYVIESVVDVFARAYNSGMQLEATSAE